MLVTYIIKFKILNTIDLLESTSFLCNCLQTRSSALRSGIVTEARRRKKFLFILEEQFVPFGFGLAHRPRRSRTLCEHLSCRLLHNCLHIICYLIVKLILDPQPLLGEWLGELLMFLGDFLNPLLSLLCLHLQHGALARRVKICAAV
jgi:hypothetical protein